MPNYAEELVFWYLRLNGFFPLNNYVVHRSRYVKYSSDIDILAIRLPFVYEEIGGQKDDWDDSLFSLFESDIQIGLLCQVKSGRFDRDSIFNREAVKYSVSRFGFTLNHIEICDSVQKKNLTVVKEEFQIGKALFSNGKKRQHTDHYFHFYLPHIRQFIKSRIMKYPKEKYSDRMFFSSVLVQEMIDTTVLDRSTEDNIESEQDG